MANKIIDRINLGGADDYYFSAVSAGNVPAAGVAGDLAWGNVSGLAKTSADLNATEGFLTPDQTSAAIAKQVDDAISGLGTAMNFKGTCTVEELRAKTDAKAGDVWNLSNDGEITTGVKVHTGDNVVRTADDNWDVLAAYIDLGGYATEEWVNQNYSATSAAVANAATTSDDFTEANSGKLVTVAAASAYIEDKISETVAETIDIVNDINGAAASAIPNAGAVSGYIEADKVKTSADIVAKNDNKILSVGAFRTYYQEEKSTQSAIFVPDPNTGGEVGKLVISLGNIPST